jgi:hypothetical protein
MALYREIIGNLSNIGRAVAAPTIARFCMGQRSHTGVDAA